MAYKILIVDDEKDVVSLLKDYFELNQYETITAYSGNVYSTVRTGIAGITYL